MTISSSIPNLLSASSALDSHGTSKTEAFSEVFTSWLSKTSRIWVHPFFESLLRKRPSIKSWLHLGRKILPYDGIVVKKTPRLAKIDCLKFLLTKLAQINFKQHYHLKDRAQAFMMGGHLRHGSVLKPHISNFVYNNDVMHDAVHKFLRSYFVPTGVIPEGTISSVYNV